MNTETQPDNLIRNIVSGSKVIEVASGKTATIDHEFINTKIKNGRVTTTHGVLLNAQEPGPWITIESFRQGWRLAEGEPQSTW